MKVEVRCSSVRYKQEQKFVGDVTVVYPNNCLVAHISVHGDEVAIAIDHPFTTRIEEQSGYPQKMLWVEPAYRED